MSTFAGKQKPTQEAEPANSTMATRPFSGQSREVRSILHSNRTIGSQAVQRLLGDDVEEFEGSPVDSASTRFTHDFSRIPVYAKTPVNVQTKPMVNAPGDLYEQEADRVAERLMRMPEPKSQRACTCGGECPKCRAEQLGRDPDLLQTKRVQANVAEETVAPPIVNEVLRSPGQPLDAPIRALFEPRFGFDFSQVRVHANEKAAESAHAVNALAYTFGQNVVFGAGLYAPRTKSGLRLLAHELTHVIQQDGANTDREQPHSLSPVEQPHIQRTLGDGHDLTSPRFSRLLDLEAAYDDETVIRLGSTGRGVQAIQQALYDLGFPLPVFGADGDFGSETEAAVKAFQRANPPLADDGEVGDLTMAALDARFGAVALPVPAVLSAPWTQGCVRSVLCPWSPHTIDVLRTRITLKSFDSISWADERWDGAAWVLDPFPGAGYNTGTEIGVLNDSCESMSETLYHEVLHAEQPMIQSTTLEKEAYAYRIGEEFSIAMGLGGRPSLRSTDPQGREFASRAKIGTFLAPGGAASYPGVPAGGGSDQIIGKAATPGHVRMQRPDGSIYTRPAAVGEKVPGPIALVNEVTHPAAGWTCP